MPNVTKNYDRPATVAGFPATQETENAHFLKFLKGNTASYLLACAADAAEEFGTSEDIVEAVSTEEIAIDAYAEKIDLLHGAAADAQAALEGYIDRCGYRDDMLNATSRILAGEADGWNDLITAAHYCQHSDAKLTLELRKKLRKLKVKGMTFRQAHYYAQRANNDRLARERTESHGPLILRGGIGDDTFEVRGTDHPILYVYCKVGGRHVEKCTPLGEMDPLALAEQLLAELPVAA